MIIAIDGVPDVAVAHFNVRLLEIFKKEEMVFRFLKSPTGDLAVRALRTGQGFIITREPGSVEVRCFKVEPTSNEEGGT